MANEITQTCTLTALSGQFSASTTQTKTIDQTNKLKHDVTVSVGTSEENLTFGDLTQPRLVQFTNLDPTNYVRLGPDSTGMVPMIRLLPGETCQLALEPSITVVAQANTGAVRLAMTALDA